MRSVLIVGDLNSYAKEYPIAALEGKGFTNLGAKIGAEAYPYVSTAHGATSTTRSATLRSSRTSRAWPSGTSTRIASVLDYNDDFKSAGSSRRCMSPDKFRVSDHEVVVVLDLNAPPSADQAGRTRLKGGSVTVTAAGTDEDGDALTYVWDLQRRRLQRCDRSEHLAPPRRSTARRRAPSGCGEDAEYDTVDTATVSVTNVAPTATFNAPASVFAGFPIALSLTNGTDVAPAISGLSYAFDSAAARAVSSASTASCPTDAVGPRTVGEKVPDDDGDFTENHATAAVVVTFDSLCALVRVYVDVQSVADSLCEKLDAAEAKMNRKGSRGDPEVVRQPGRGAVRQVDDGDGSGDAGPTRRSSVGQTKGE